MVVSIVFVYSWHMVARPLWRLPARRTELRNAWNIFIGIFLVLFISQLIFAAHGKPQSDSDFYLVARASDGFAIAWHPYINTYRFSINMCTYIYICICICAARKA